MASVAAQESTGGVPNLLNGPRHAVPFRAPYPDEQFQRNQPLYLSSSQPFLPYQWPLTPHYVPYGGVHGLGYGMLMPSVLLPPYVEVPGYMPPHAPMHMLDYRRILSPHMAPNTAHQAYRSRFQNGVTRSRVMVSSEVQTEPLCPSSTQDSRNHAASSHTGSESGRGTGSGSPASASASFSENKSVACLEETSVLTQNRVIATNTINTTDLSKGDVLLQAERVQIKCSETPSRLKIVCSNENAELSSNDTGDILQCSLGSIRSEDVILCSYQSLEFRKDKRRIEAGTLKPHRKRCPPARNKPANIRMSPSVGTFGAHPKPSRSNRFEANRSSVMQIQKSSKLVMGKHDANSFNNVDCKILRLPFDRQCPNQTRQLEASIWSVESLVPYVPSSEWLLRNGVLTPQKSPVSDGRNQQVGESIPYRPSTSWLADFGNVYYYSKLPVLQQKLGSFCNSPEKQLHNTPLKGEDEKKMKNQGIRTGMCDHMCGCLFHSCRCTTKSSPRPAGSRTRCGWFSHFSLVDKIPGHLCKNDFKGRSHGKISLSDSLCCKREDDSELKIFDGKKAAKDHVGAHHTQKMLREAQVGKCHQAKLTAQANLCDGCRCLHASPGPKRGDPQELDDVLSVSCRWSNTERSQKESWDGGMQESDMFDKERTEYVHLPGSTQGDKVLWSTRTQRSHPAKTAH